MHGLAKIRGLKTLYILKELPDDRDELDLVVEGGKLSIPPDVVEWYRTAPEEPALALGVSKIDPRQYRMFKSRDDVEPAGFEPVDLSYGGVYTPEMWRRLVRMIPGMRAFAAIPPDPPGVMEKALEYIREGR